MISLEMVVTKFHVSLNVRELARSIDFYSVLFDRKPAKRFEDYCKFEVDEPPLIISLVPRAPSSGASLTHLGLNLPTNAAVEEVEERLERAGYATRTQDETMCGYARQYRCWVADPDGNFWAVYSVAEDVDPRLTRQGLEGAEAVLRDQPASRVWEHFLTHPVPSRVPHDDGTIEEVRLASSWNTVADMKAREFLLAEAFRVLKPGGTISLRGLFSDQPLKNASPDLSGLVVPIIYVPHREEVCSALRSAGFEGIEFANISDPPRFHREEMPLRDMQLLARKPLVATNEKTVIYKGPFAQCVQDDGQVFPRGTRVKVAAPTWDILRRGLAAETFLFLNPDAPATCGSPSFQEV